MLPLKKPQPETLDRYSFLTSLLLHGIFFVALVWPQAEAPKSEIIELDVFVPPKEAKLLIPKKAFIPTQASPKANPKAQPVFGVSRNSLTDSPAPDAAVTKAGNTLSKEPDNKTLNPGDEALPSPADDFEVSTWPSLQNTVHIPYPREAKQKNVEGDVVMDLYINETGEVKRATLVQGPGYGLNEAATTAARQFRFSPALVNGKAVPVVIRYTYKFKIQR